VFALEEERRESAGKYEKELFAEPPTVGPK